MGDKLSMVALDKFEKRLSIPLRVFVKRARTRPADRPCRAGLTRDNLHTPAPAVPGERKRTATS